MATFQQKQWVDRVSEYPTRRVLTDVSTEQTQTVTVTRSEGQVSSEGDAFNATNMNDLEERISNVVNDMTQAFQAGVDAVYDALVAIGIRPSASTPEAIARAIATVGSGNATANQILSGKTAYASHSLITGTMTNRGNWTATSSGAGNVTIPQGYHAGGGYVNCDGAYNAGWAAKKNKDSNNGQYTDLWNIRNWADEAAGKSGERVDETWTDGNDTYIRNRMTAIYNATIRIMDLIGDN